MSHGKTVCQHLKAIRRDIARENGIDLEIPECTFKGECCGTCPQCESELRTLEHELAKRISIGKVATVAGLALGLATPLAAQNVEPQKQPTLINATETHKESILKPNKAHEFTISGIVTDSVNKEPLPFANVVLKYNDTIIARSQTDFEGKYILKNIAGGIKYQLGVTNVGFSPKNIEIIPRKKNTFLAILMAPTPIPTPMMGLPDTPSAILETNSTEDIINVMGAFAPSESPQNIRCDSLKVKVKD